MSTMISNINFILRTKLNVKVLTKHNIKLYSKAHVCLLLFNNMQSARAYTKSNFLPLTTNQNQRRFMTRHSHEPCPNK